MEFVEHDLKALMETMREPFLQSEIKTLMLQLLSAIDCLHRNWIIHRDLKTSNLLMKCVFMRFKPVFLHWNLILRLPSNRGQIKVADFGLARRVGDPPGPITQLVVTLWYR
jgi:cell division cycle 2-like protein